MRDARSRHPSWLWPAMFVLAACSTEQEPVSASGGASAGIAGEAASSIGGASPSGGAVGGGFAGALTMGGSDAGRAGLGGSSGESGASLGGASLGGASAGGTSNGGASSSAGSSGASVAGAGGASAGASAAGGTSAGGSSAGGAGGGKGYQPCPTSPGAACAVLPLGDSITEGFGSSGAGYRVELFKQAVQNGKNLTFVGSLQNGPDTVQNVTFPKHHEGHDGFTIAGNSGISGAITDQAIANYHPNIVLLMIGTNDINGNVDVANAPSRLGSLIDDITTRAPNALVVVATIIPIANAGTNQKVQTYNAALVGIVSARASAGKHVTLVDNYAAFSKVPNYASTIMYNYLHPNDAGYVVLGDSFYGAISALLPSGT